MEFKFKKGELVRYIGSSYIGLQGKHLVVDDFFSLSNTPTYKLHIKDEEWKKYIFYENTLKSVRRKKDVYQ